MLVAKYLIKNIRNSAKTNMYLLGKHVTREENKSLLFCSRKLTTAESERSNTHKLLLALITNEFCNSVRLTESMFPKRSGILARYLISNI